MLERRGVWLFIGTAVLYGLFFGGRTAWKEWHGTVRLETSKAEYLHDEFIEIRLWTRDRASARRLAASPQRVIVTRDGRTVRTVGGIEVVPLSYLAASDRWTGRWPCPWNAPPGEYRLRLLGDPGIAERLRMSPFRVSRRKPAPMPQGMSVLTLESSDSLADMKVRTPSGETKDWRGLLDWVEYAGADAFWMLGGETPGQGEGEVWLSRNFRVFPEVARECRRRGIKFGLYAMCYLTTSKTVRLKRYEYAREVEEGGSVETRAISLRDPRRPEDIAALLKQFRDIPGVDYVGLDYIRNALGGYELVDEFLAEFPGLKPPEGWAAFTREERMVWLARKKGMRRDLDFIDAWQWWRAHRVGQIVRRIKAEVGDATPLWAFTLTWDKGWHHGQDPVMMNDAGVDIDALMLYEATEDQFEALLKDWRRYVRRDDVQLLVGNVIDWPLHQRSELGPRSFYSRLLRGMDRVYADGPAVGIFSHDLQRALWGRLGTWTTRQWLDEVRRAGLRAKSLVPAGSTVGGRS
ncbi:MAG: hypothetical protein HZB91_05865 [Elusimicrobia bacterium]|nr:hypothetical protein [Elusimicrobiota bacterium]